MAFALFVASAVSAFAAPSHAEPMWLAPAVPARAAIGPAKAEGAVIWLHGRSADAEDSTAPSPPYLAALREGGWDVFRFNRMREADRFATTSPAVVEQVRVLKRQGYRQVALAGQSFGGFIALLAADASDGIDAVLLTAPAAYGNFSDYYDSWRNNATRLYPLLEGVRSPRVMAFYFHGDDFDPGGRGERTSEILAVRKLPHVVVDQPPHLTSHWAATTPEFATLYSGCILGFIGAAKVGEGADCHGGVFVAGRDGDAHVATTGPAPSGMSVSR